MDLLEKARVLREVLNDSELMLLQAQSAEVKDMETNQAVSIALRMIPAPTQIQ
jgi:hypothetical protein